MSQQQGGGWGGPPPGGGGQGGWGGPPQGGGGYGPPAGGGGYGPPPGGGGYGPPPGAPPGGYGPPPGAPPGGYGPPPGGGYGGPPGGGYGGPPGGGGFVPPPGGPMAVGGGRVQFTGEGMDLFKIYLLYNVAPLFGGYLVAGTLVGLGTVIEKQARTGGAIMGITGLLGGLIMMAAIVAIAVLFGQKFTEFHYNHLRIDGQQCEYRGTMGEFAKVVAVNVLLSMVSFGIYSPWAFVNVRKFVYANTLVNGQPGRLSFDGQGGDLLGKYIVGMLLTYCTLGIYMFWFMNDFFAFQWENSKLDGRPFQFRRDPGGLFGALIVNYLLTMCTGGLYSPWMICNLHRWEAEHVS